MSLHRRSCATEKRTVSAGAQLKLHGNYPVLDVNVTRNEKCSLYCTDVQVSLGFAQCPHVLTSDSGVACEASDLALCMAYVSYSGDRSRMVRNAAEVLITVLHAQSRANGK